MTESPALRWLGGEAGKLHPLLRELHARGGVLRGEVNLEFGAGLAGALGRRFARHLGLPAQAGPHSFEVHIREENGALRWDRCFDGATWQRSVFTPVGSWPQGHWREGIGAARMRLSVDVADGAWHWRLLGMSWLGLPLPSRLLSLAAWKRIEDGHYRFHAGFALAGVGKLFLYEGLLEAAPAQ